MFAQILISHPPSIFELVFFFLVFMSIVYFFARKLNKFFEKQEERILRAAAENRSVVTLAFVAIMVGSIAIVMNQVYQSTNSTTRAAPPPTVTPSFIFPPTLTPTPTPWPKITLVPSNN